MKRLVKLFDGGLRMLDQERLVRASGYFDAAWYVSTYLEVDDPANALTHFMQKGAAMGYDPGPGFSTSAYLSANPDVRDAGYNALVHYLRFGRAEGRGAANPVRGAAQPLGTAAMARIVEAFDAAFYVATNPDLADLSDSLSHFLADGWRERRDPCSWFSVEDYLASHPDVADTGQNPFVHYLLWGCREARAIRPSRRPSHKRTDDPAAPRRLAALAMVRNEGDIIRTFARHLLALFDDIVIVDHMSDDGTAEFLDALAGGTRRVAVLRLEEPAYVQSVTMTHAVRDLPVLREADWVFLLDADEFLPFASRQDFEAAMARYARCPVIDMRWKNLVPRRYWDGEADLIKETEFVAPVDVSPFRKVAFQPKRLSLKRTVVAQGNHSLSETLNGFEVPSFAADFPLYHLPVRSVDQLVLKLNQGVEAYRRLGRTRDAAHGTHWDQMLRATTGTEMNDQLLNAVVARYSEDKPALVPKSIDTLIAEGHRAETIRIAGVELDIAAPPCRRLGEMLMRIHSRPAQERETVDCPSATRLTLEGSVLRRTEDDSGAEYAALPDTELTDEGTPSPSALVAALLSPGYRDIEDLVPSPKAGHVPFLFSLTEIARPRRFVEIGTLRGASFFAVCQAAREAGLGTEAVAVSAWSVEPEQSEAYRGVFETFSFLARKYADFASYLRLRHEVAADRFAVGSIDLLHLDGFCEAGPLEGAIEMWLPKLSDRGILMLHDVNAHGGQSAVWQVWDTLQSRYPTLDFPHDGGLGIACVGRNAAPGLVALCELLADDRDLRLMVRRHFDQQGRMSSELFSRRYDMAQSAARLHAEGAQAEELSWLRQKLETLRRDNDQLRGLLKGNIANALSG